MHMYVFSEPIQFLKGQGSPFSRTT